MMLFCRFQWHSKIANPKKVSVIFGSSIFYDDIENDKLIFFGLVKDIMYIMNSSLKKSELKNTSCGFINYINWTHCPIQGLIR